jgi:hypothetical protein
MNSANIATRSRAAVRCALYLERRLPDKRNKASALSEPFYKLQGRPRSRYRRVSIGWFSRCSNRDTDMRRASSMSSSLHVSIPLPSFKAETMSRNKAKALKFTGPRTN